MKKIFFLSLAVIFTAVCSFAQTASWKNLRHSVYFGGGVNVYFGDLGHAKETSHAFSVRDISKESGGYSFQAGYKFKLLERLSLRGNILYSKIHGDDNYSKNPALNNRNLRFKSNLWDLSANVDFYFIKEKEIPEGQKIKFSQRWSSYIFIGLAGIHYNPKGGLIGDEDNWQELRPLHSEGQGEIDGADSEYGNWTFSYPFGLGVNFLITRKFYIGLELTQHYTTTDYLDDVSTNYYKESKNIYADQHLNASGKVVSQADKYPTGTARGGSDYNDSYFTVLMNLGFKFGKSSSEDGKVEFIKRPKYF